MLIERVKIQMEVLGRTVFKSKGGDHCEDKSELFFTIAL